jgi:2-methylcitrate dehydratase PrpD
MYVASLLQLNIEKEAIRKMIQENPSKILGLDDQPRRKGMNENSPTKRLASFVSNLKYSDLPKTVVDHMKLCLIDTIGCGLFGSTLPWGKILAKFAKDLGGKKESTLLGMKYKASAPNAALANGTMIHGFELDDIHRLSILHPGSVTLPAALAVGESRKKCTGKEFLTAMIAGYETGLRIGMCVGASHLHKGYHPTGTHGTFAAAAAAGKLLGLDEEKMTIALALPERRLRASWRPSMQPW